jgi:hypothetical protein
MGYWSEFYWKHKGNRAFIEGAIAGVTALAVWKDGEQLVGVSMRPLEDEIKRIKQELEWKEEWDG